MFQLISKLQNKPERERHAIAFWFAASVTGVIALVWITSLIALRVAAPATTSAVSTDSALPSSEDFEEIGATAVNFYEQFKQNIDQVTQGLDAGATLEAQTDSPAPEETPAPTVDSSAETSVTQ